MSTLEHYVVEMTLEPIPPDVYQQRGYAEMDYTQEQVNNGALIQLMVTEDHKRYWLTFAVDSEASLLAILKGFPLYDYFNYRYYKVQDMIAAAAAGVTDPNLKARE